MNVHVQFSPYPNRTVATPENRDDEPGPRASVASTVRASAGWGQTAGLGALLAVRLMWYTRCRRSLVALDELGRGTATMDGQAIATAVLHEVVHRVGCRGVFATHYHQMADLWAEHSGVAVNHMACDVENDPASVVPKVRPRVPSLVTSGQTGRVPAVD